MLDQFRVQYPNGNLISELLQIYQGKFVVRVSVQVEAVIRATGMAAAETIELAEDQARIRALLVLGIHPTVTGLEPLGAPIPGETSTSSNQVITPPRENGGLAMGASDKQDSLSSLRQTDYQELAQPEPFDLSDVIARTEVQLQRLGWSREKGRDYLLRTYGKRSRQQLTDQQLLEFLNYLESQPPLNNIP